MSDVTTATITATQAMLLWNPHIRKQTMSKKQWKADGEEAHRQVLDLLKEHEGRSFSQSDIMEDFFRVFRTAYDGGCCCPLTCNFDARTNTNQWVWPKATFSIRGASILAYAKKDGWINSTTSTEGDRYENINRVMEWWEAWTYACKALGRRVRYRTINRPAI